MTHDKLMAHLTRALGREIDGPAERRLVHILTAQILLGGEEAERQLVESCDHFEVAMARGQMPRCPILRPPSAGG